MSEALDMNRNAEKAAEPEFDEVWFPGRRNEHRQERGSHRHQRPPATAGGEGAAAERPARE